jgi:hypothetical protein
VPYKKGQFFFAWVNENEVWSDLTHARWDENVYSFELAQEEGDFASFQAVIKNPRIGLLNVGRKVWCYYAVYTGSAIVVLFKGRLLGVPTNVFASTVTLEFTARSSDFVDQKAALATTMKVRPYYDSMVISPDSWSDPDAVLEGYSRHWHIHPVTHVVTSSDIIVPEDGVEEVTEQQHSYDDLELTIGQTPLRAVSVTCTVPWTQAGSGSLDLTGMINVALGTSMIGAVSSFTFQGLQQDWPKQGDDLGPGWTVSGGSLTPSIFGYATIPDIFTYNGTPPLIPTGSYFAPIQATGEYHWGETAGFNFQFELAIAAIGYGVAQLSATWERNSEYSQVITFTLQTDQQALLTSPGDDESLAISLTANKASDPDEDESIPIGDVLRGDFVHSPRGQQLVEHLLLLGRAALVARSRAISITFIMPFLDGIRCCNLRKGVHLHNHRLPGGEAEGKVTQYRLALDGSTGRATAEIHIGCCVGYGTSLVETPGENSYSVDYSENYEEQINGTTLVDTQDILYTMPASEVFDDGWNFPAGINVHDAVLQLTASNLAPSQLAAITGKTKQDDIETVLQAMPTTVFLKMKPMEGGPFNREVVISVSDLVIPKQIDLEAPSNA